MSVYDGPDYRVTRAIPDLFVDQNIRSLYTSYSNRNQFESALAVIDTYLVGVEWLPVANWCNETGTRIVYKKSLETGPTHTFNSGVANIISFPAIICNLNVNFGGLRKSFGSEETISPSTTSVDITVEPGSRTVFYQRRWTFRHEVSCLCNSNGNIFTVGARGWNDTTLRAQKCTVVTQIRSSDFLVRPGGFEYETEDVATNSNPTPIKSQRVCNLDELSSKVRNHLVEWGLIFPVCPEEPQIHLSHVPESKVVEEKLLMDGSLF